MSLSLGLLLLGLGVDGGAPPKCAPFADIDRTALKPATWKWVSTEGDRVIDVVAPAAGCLYVTVHRWPSGQHRCHSRGEPWVKAEADGLHLGMDAPAPDPEHQGLCRAMPSQTGEAAVPVPQGVTRLHSAGDLNVQVYWLPAP